MKLKYILTLLIISVFTNLFALPGQSDEDRFFYAPDADSDLKVILPENSFAKKGIQYGAILSPVYMFEDNDSGKLGSYVLNAKLWAKSYLWSNSFLYVRGKESYLGIAKNDGVYSEVESDNVIDLDLAFLSMSTKSSNMNLSVGRKFYNMGTGLVLNGRGDGGEASWYGSGFSVNVLGLYTGLLLKDNNPYGLSDKDISDGAKRAFAGGSASTEFINQKIYIFGLAQMDFADEDSDAKSRYSSQYYGAGLEGVVLGNMAYFAELVYERGTSYIAGTEDKSSISAFAVNTGIDYFIPVKLNPSLSLQYAYGSGDEDRQEEDNTSVQPAGSDSDDNGFISFGTFSGGFALKPSLSNIHVIRGGFAFVPFSWSDISLIKKISLGAKYSYYRKDKKESGINSGEAYMPESAIGQGIDATLRWQLYYDLSFYVNYGLFMPGKAYDDEGSRNFIMAGMNLSI